MNAVEQAEARAAEAKAALTAFEAALKPKTQSTQEAKTEESMTTAVEENLIEESTAIVPLVENLNEEEPPPLTEEEILELDAPLTEEEVIEMVQQGRAKGKSSDEIITGLSRCRCAVSDSRLKEIVSATEPAEPKVVKSKKPTQPKSSVKFAATFPPELAPLVTAGHAFFDDMRQSWMVKGCRECGQFNRDECCGQKTVNALAVRFDGTLTQYGRQAVGLDPIRPPAKTSEPTPEQKQKTWAETNWWKTFSGFDELEDGGLKMYIENFLPEGIAIISSLPKEGKTWLALSIVKALTTGQPLFGKSGFEVTEQVPVVYLAAEASDRAFKHRARKFGITNDKTKFLCRTLTKGMIGLQNPDLEAAVRALKPVVILDVLSCFNQSDDEDDAVQNQKLRSMIGSLRTQGAPVVIVLHHATKNFKDKPTKENAVRGSGDILAMVDVVWALMIDDRLFQSGVKEVDVIGWGRDFEAAPMRLALTRKSTGRDLSIFGPGIASIIDETGDLGWVDKEAVREAAKKAVDNLADNLEQAVNADPKASLRTLAESTGESVWAISQALEGRGWRRGKGRYGAWTCRKEKQA